MAHMRSCWRRSRSVSTPAAPLASKTITRYKLVTRYASRDTQNRAQAADSQCGTAVNPQKRISAHVDAGAGPRGPRQLGHALQLIRFQGERALCAARIPL